MPQVEWTGVQEREVLKLLPIMPQMLPHHAPILPPSPSRAHQVPVGSLLCLTQDLARVVPPPGLMPAPHPCFPNIALCAVGNKESRWHPVLGNPFSFPKPGPLPA